MISLVNIPRTAHCILNKQSARKFDIPALINVLLLRTDEVLDAPCDHGWHGSEFESHLKSKIEMVSALTNGIYHGTRYITRNDSNNC